MTPHREHLALVCLVLFAAAICHAPAMAHPAIEQQISDLDERIAESPAEAALYLRRGELHRIHREWKLAEADYVKALRLEPELLTAEMCLGKMKLEQGRPKQARESLQRYLEKRPQDTVARVAFARALAQLSRHLEAAAEFDRAIRSVHDGKPKPEYYLERARALAGAGRKHYDAALAGLDEGLARLGQPVTLQNYAIELELERRHYDQALDRLDRMWSGSARRETWLVRRGEILERAGRFDEARAAYGETLTAIEALSARRQSNRAVARLADEARSGLARIADRADAPPKS